MKRLSIHQNDFEDDCGFKFRRVSKVPPPVAPAVMTTKRIEETSNDGASLRPLEEEAASSANFQNAIKTTMKEVEIPLAPPMESNNFKSKDASLMVTPAKKDKKRRRSSFASIASRSGHRPSSFSVSLSTSTHIEFPHSSFLHLVFL